MNNSRRIVFLMGGPSSGKTTICQNLLEAYPDNFNVVTLANIFQEYKQIEDYSRSTQIQDIYTSKRHSPEKYQIIKSKMIEGKVLLVEGYPFSESGIQLCYGNFLEYKPLFIFFQCSKQEMIRRETKKLNKPNLTKDEQLQIYNLIKRWKQCQSEILNSLYLDRLKKITQNFNVKETTEELINQLLGESSYQNKFHYLKPDRYYLIINKFSKKALGYDLNSPQKLKWYEPDQANNQQIFQLVEVNQKYYIVNCEFDSYLQLKDNTFIFNQGNRQNSQLFEIKLSNAINVKGQLYFKVKLKDTKNCLELKDGKLILSKVQVNKDQQRFKFVQVTQNPTLRRTAVIVNDLSGKALDSRGLSSQQTVVQKTLDYRWSQRWYIEDAGNGYFIKSLKGGLVLNISGMLKQDGSKVVLGQKKIQSFESQTWGFEQKTNNLFKILSHHSKSYLAISSQDKEDGGKLEINSKQNSSMDWRILCQHFEQPNFLPGKYYQIINKGTGKALGSDSNYIKAFQQDQTKDNQIFNFLKKGNLFQIYHSGTQNWLCKNLIFQITMQKVINEQQMSYGDLWKIEDNQFYITQTHPIFQSNGEKHFRIRYSKESHYCFELKNSKLICSKFDYKNENQLFRFVEVTKNSTFKQESEFPSFKEGKYYQIICKANKKALGYDKEKSQITHSDSDQAKDSQIFKFTKTGQNYKIIISQPGLYLKKRNKNIVFQPQISDQVAQNFCIIREKDDSSDKYFTVKTSKDNEYCLELKDGKLILSKVQVKKDQQLFKFVQVTQNPTLRRTAVIVNDLSGKALDSRGLSSQQTVVQKTLDYRWSQRWYIEDAGNGYFIKSLKGGLVLNISGMLKQNGSKVVLGQKKIQSFESQTWGFEQKTNNLFKILSHHSKSYLAISSQDKEDGGKLEINSKQNSSMDWRILCQHFEQPNFLPGKYYQIINKGTGKALGSDSIYIKAFQQDQTKDNQIFQFFQSGSNYKILNSSTDHFLYFDQNKVLYFFNQKYEESKDFYIGKYALSKNKYFPIKLGKQSEVCLQLKDNKLLCSQYDFKNQNQLFCFVEVNENPTINNSFFIVNDKTKKAIDCINLQEGNQLRNRPLSYRWSQRWKVIGQFYVSINSVIKKSQFKVIESNQDKKVFLKYSDKQKQLIWKMIKQGDKLITFQANNNSKYAFAYLGVYSQGNYPGTESLEISTYQNGSIYWRLQK